MKNTNTLKNGELKQVPREKSSISNIESITITDIVNSEEQHIAAKEDLAVHHQQKNSQPEKPSYFYILFSALFSLLFDWFSPVTKIYQSYKDRGMLGIFTLTIVGIGLTLAGFGYLMQLLIDQMGAGTKSMLMASAAVFVVALGFIIKIKTRYGEYATAIVSLGLLLAYSTVYFSGSVYHLISNITVLILYLVIAMCCYFVAVWLDTKVVATLGLVGIATMPILSNTVQLDALYYLMSLAFVVASSLLLAYQRLGHWIASLSLAFSVVAIEWIIGVESVALSAWVIDLFYMLFFAYAVMVMFNNKISQGITLKFITATVGATIVLFFQSGSFISGEMSYSFGLNTLLAICAVIVFYKIRHELTKIMALLAALWCVLTIVSLVSDAYWGIAWAVEGLLLIYIGRQCSMRSVVHQGQVLTALALFYSWSALAIYFPLPALKSIDGWMLSLVIVGVIAVWQRMINDNVDVFDLVTVKKIKPVLQLFEVIWVSMLVIASANIWLGNWAGVLVILLQLAILFRAKYCKQVSIDFFAAVLIVVPLFYVSQGALIAGSYQFTHLPLFAQLSVVSAFIQLWLWAEFYRKYQVDNQLNVVAENARILFYMLIPVCWIGSSLRHLDVNFLMALWLSPLLALLIAHKFKHKLLVIEAKLAVVLTGIVFFVVIGSLKLSYGLISFIGFLILYSCAYFMYKRKMSAQLSQFFCSCGLITLGIAIPSFIGFQLNSLFDAVLFASLYWAFCFNAVAISTHLKRNELFITLINVFLLIWAWAMVNSSVYYALIPCVFLLACLYKKQERYKTSLLAQMFGLNSGLLLHTIIAITYTSFFIALISTRLDLLIAPALAVHGALILFMKDRRVTTVKYSFALMFLGIVKLALLDAANALLWQKVILFMGLGVFILVASFWYQKLVKNTEELVTEM